MVRRVWTEAEESLLVELYKNNTLTADIAKRLDRSMESVGSKIGRMNLATKIGKVADVWTPEELELLAELWVSETPTVEISELLGRTPEAVRTMVFVQKFGRKGRKSRESRESKTAAPVRRNHRRKVTEEEKGKLLRFWESFYRVYALAEQKGIATSRASMFEPFLVAYGTEERRRRGLDCE